MALRGNANGIAVKALASSAQLWRLNTLGVLEIRQKPDSPLGRDVAKALLRDLADADLWKPEPRLGKTAGRR